jgi:hypothetical protein
MAPAAAWRPDGWMLGACVYSGVFATAVNNVLLARVTRRLGPTTANLYMPLQPLTTVLIDYLTLGDAVYLANLLCGLGVMAGLVLAVVGKHAADAARGGGGGGARLGAARSGDAEREEEEEGERASLLRGKEEEEEGVEMCVGGAATQRVAVS